MTGSAPPLGVPPTPGPPAAAPVLPGSRRLRTALLLAAGAAMLGDLVWLHGALFGSRLWHGLRWGLAGGGAAIGLLAWLRRG